MNVLILYDNEYPGFSPGAKRLKNYADGLILNGDLVEIIGISWRSSNKLLFYLNPFFQPFIVLKRIFQSNRKSDIILVYGFFWNTFLVLYLLKKLYNIKIVFELNEKPGSVYGSRLTEISFVKRINTYLTAKTLNVFDGFLVISGSLFEYISSITKKKHNILKIPILVNLDECFDIPDKTETFDFIFHAGAFSDQKDGIVNMIHGFALFKQRVMTPFKLLFTQSKAPSSTLIKVEHLIEKFELRDDIVFTGILTNDQICYYQKNSFCGIINKPVNEQNTNNFPTKLGEYLAMSTPVIVTKVGEMVKYLKHLDTAFLIDDNSPENVCNALWQLYINPELAKKIGNNGFNLAHQAFDHKINGERLHLFLHQLVSSSFMSQQK